MCFGLIFLFSFFDSDDSNAISERGIFALGPWQETGLSSEEWGS